VHPSRGTPNHQTLGTGFVPTEPPADPSDRPDCAAWAHLLAGKSHSSNKMKKAAPFGTAFFILLRGQDLNLRPLGYEPSELPNCSTPRHKGQH
jgi:hypothetical protein